MADIHSRDELSLSDAAPASNGNAWSLVLGFGLVACALRSDCRVQSVAEGIAAGALLYRGLCHRPRPAPVETVLGDLPG